MLKEHDEMNKEIKKSKDLNSSSRILVYLKNNVINFWSIGKILKVQIQNWKGCKRKKNNAFIKMQSVW